MKTPFFAKIFIGYLVIILMLSAASLLTFSDAFRQLHKEMLTEDLKDVALSVKTGVGESVGVTASSELDRAVKQLGRQLNTRITLIDVKGTVLADSEENPRSMENHRNRPEIVGALSGRVSKATRFSSTMNQEAIYVAVPLQKNGEIKGAARVGVFVKDVKIPPGLSWRVAGVAAILALLALMAALIISGSISRPLKDLTDAARRFAAGDFATRVFLRRSDEFKTLGDTFNSMGREIQTTFEKLSRQKTELKSIIDSLREGLLVVDKRGAVVYCNESLKGIAGQESRMEGRFYWEVLGQPQFIELIEKARSGRLHEAEEAEMDGKTFLASAVRLDKEEETILVLHDVTGMKQVEKIKRDLVTNVSHELRTPLTSIKGFVETLEEEVDEKHRRYVEIIKRNTDRLINIVQDLLLLSRLEEGRSAGLEIENVDLKGLVERTVHLFDQQAKEKQLTVRLEIAPDLPAMQGDSFKIEQMIINLLDNALKYTDTGEIKVVLKPQDRYMLIEIHDTGIGIPREKLPRVFERFYVVDKGRSRKMGGTGLGLSIVKHIVLLHKGHIRIESTLGQGTHLFIKLPLQQIFTPDRS